MNQQKRYWFKCPRCGWAQVIGLAQAYGEEDIACTNSECTFNERGYVSPILDAYTVLPVGTTFLFRRSQPHE